MKRNWLLYLVIFSLALNLGTIGTLAYLRYQDPRAAAPEMAPPLGMRALWGTLQLEGPQRQALRGLFPEHRRQVRQIQEELAQKRLELFELVKSDSPPWDAIQAKVREISALQGSLEEEMVRFMLAFKQQLKPHQHAAFMDLVQTRLGRVLGGPGRGCGPMGPPHGRGRGPGAGPPGACPE